MIFYSFRELLLIAAAAIAIDWIVGDPKWPTHPVIWIGRLIRLLERKLHRDGAKRSPSREKLAGIALTAVTLAVSFGTMWAVTAAAAWVHP